MKKRVIVILLLIYILLPHLILEPKAQESADYQAYSEVMLSSGKLIRYYTEEELEAMYKETEGVHFINIIVHIDNKSVDGSYISNTLYSVDNTSKTAIEYNLEYTIETNNKVSFQSGGSISGSGSGTLKKIKLECSAKANVDYSKTTTESVKEKRTMKLSVEPNSRLIVYLTGELTVTNGAVAAYYYWFRAYVGPFEFVTLKSQFSRLEKRSI